MLQKAAGRSCQNGQEKKTGNDPKILVVTNKYKYNGKELQDELGLAMYDYGARNNKQTSIFNGIISAQDFTSTAAFSIAGGAAAQRINGSSWFKGATLGSDMYSSVRFGQTAGNAAGKLTSGFITNAPVFGAGVAQKKIP